LEPQILVIDDEEILRDVIKEVLDFMKIPAVFAESGQVGIEQFKQHIDHIRLVLLDVLMPGMSGVEAFKQIQSLNPEIKVIFMSGFPDNDALAIQNLPGTNEFIKKPFSVQEIMTTIQKML
jgi:DNA-binding NtrC family response regulator